MGNALAFTGDRNRPGINRKTGKPWTDFTGAFLPEANRYLNYYDDRYSVTEQGELKHISLGVSDREQRKHILGAIYTHEPYEVAFFCHGLTTKIELGFGNLTVDELANALKFVGCERVALHACLTGKLDWGFAATLAKKLGPGSRVLGSTTSGHTSRNPNRRLFTGEGGNGWIVHPSDPEWREWKRRMRDGNDPLRWQLIEKTRPEILKELRGE